MTKTHSDVRDFYESFVERTLLGPGFGPDGDIDTEEMLHFGAMPSRVYSTGILYPRKTLDVTDGAAQDDNTDEKNQENENSVEIGPDVESMGGDLPEFDAPDEFVAGRANEFMPSAMGASFILPKNAGISVSISLGLYNKISLNDQDGKKTYRYKRAPLTDLAQWSESEITSLSGDKRTDSREIKGLPGHLKAKLHIFVRSMGGGEINSAGARLITVTLLNETKISAKSGKAKDEEFFYQCSLIITPEGEAGIPPYPDRNLVGDDDELGLLYRNNRSFAVGHGCAVAWEHAEGFASKITTEYLPRHELEPLDPNPVPDCNDLSMEVFGAEDRDIGFSLCNKLLSRYEGWIAGLPLVTSRLEVRYHAAAKRNHELCLAALKRMREGLDLLKVDRNWKAFSLANRAMLEQQKHYLLSSEFSREWTANTLTGQFVLNKLDKDGYEAALKNKKLGFWRPFQLAFILMNIRGIVEPASDDRSKVDLIWFPTGGGKTEAYLGLTAFSLFMRKLNTPGAAGTSVVMRYTLRLLTTQQFERAAALICACELLRKENLEILGKNEYTIGLWVGGAVTPNTFKDAHDVRKKMTSRFPSSKSFIVNRCPWCGAKMGRVSSKGGACGTELFGYESGTKYFKFKCPDSKCSFSGGLPLQVVDEALYQSPPSLLIGTVDKFATLAWNADSHALMGTANEFAEVMKPDLFIQDELHLISGPLGSMVGMYEVAIDGLSTTFKDGVVVSRPKIIASTATASCAIEQIKSLYDREGYVFPPQGVNADDSFFAKSYKNIPGVERRRGRAYRGILGTAGSHIMTQVKLTAALLQAAKSSNANSEFVDPYYTIVQYYNSLRELGQAATTVSAELNEQMVALRRRIGLTRPAKDGEPERRRFVNRHIELASFIESHEINDVLGLLFKGIATDADALIRARPKADDRDDWPVDICMATSMIQVGLDVQRLGLMSVVGQPKTTAEYIQSTSRVGRGGAPGLVFAVYNQSKPRDRSHLEHFNSYHSSLYRWVEPTSVTPFSLPTRERALHAVAIILARNWGGRRTLSPNGGPDAILRTRISEWILKRVRSVDPDELNSVSDELDIIFDKWCRASVSEYGKMYQEPDVIGVLMCPAGQARLTSDSPPFPTPTSMRNVDPNCGVYVAGDNK
jgi:hypothetical protein